MKKFNLVFITTFIDLRHIFKLLGSISDSNKTLHLLVIIVAQNGKEFDVTQFESEYTTFFVIKNNNVLSLSRARNEGLKYLFNQSVFFNYLMFPDDDSFFDEVFFNNFSLLVDADILIDVYCYGTNELFKPSKYKQDSILSIANYDGAMSVNIIVSYETAQKVGYFDTMMGVGAQYGAGEDIDYFIRCCNMNLLGFRYEKRLWNFHPKGIDKYKEMSINQLMKRYRNYGRGAMYLFNKHKMFSQSFKYCFFALIGGTEALIKLNFKLAIARFYAFIIRFCLFVKLYMS